MLVDTHCHLDSTHCPEGTGPILDRARAAGVEGFVAIGVGSVAVAREVVELAAKHEGVVCTVGVHPHEAGAIYNAGFEEIARLSVSPDVVAVGEIGLDYHYEHSPRDVQATVFRRFIAHAREVKKPIVVHTRSAPADTLRILEEENARDVGGIIHCFSEDRAFAERALELGFDLSFSGIVTFKNAVSVQEVAAWAPADRILVETDAPYLAPIPKRGKTNEPAYIVHTAERVAALRGISAGELAEITTRNACRRFGERLEQALRRAEQAPEAK